MTTLRRQDKWNIGSLRPRYQCDYLIETHNQNDCLWERIIMLLIGAAFAVAALI